MHVYVVKCLGMTTVAKRVKAANESAKSWKEKRKISLQKIGGNKDGTIKRVTSWGGANHLFLPTLCLFGHCSVWLLSGRMHEIIWYWIIIFFLMIWNTQLDYCASFTHTLISIFHENWSSYLLSVWLFSVNPMFLSVILA